MFCLLFINAVSSKSYCSWPEQVEDSPILPVLLPIGTSCGTETGVGLPQPCFPCPVEWVEGITLPAFFASKHKYDIYRVATPCTSNKCVLDEICTSKLVFCLLFRKL